MKYNTCYPSTVSTPEEFNPDNWNGKTYAQAGRARVRVLARRALGACAAVRRPHSACFSAARRRASVVSSLMSPRAQMW